VTVNWSFVRGKENCSAGSNVKNVPKENGSIILKIVHVNFHGKDDLEGMSMWSAYIIMNIG
jgi:hypothetical protein